MKIITFVVPCYNSSAYMEHCIETLLPGGEDIEIILVNDGSTDETAHICDRYALQYPDVVKVIHQENGGHGEGVNQGIQSASGLYFKVVDSDDWLDVPAMIKLLNRLRLFAQEKNIVDLIICNYVYEHTLDQTRTFMRYTNVFPQNRVFSWRDCRKFRASQYILMHSVIYRTKVLKECGVVLPKHTFYVDNLFVYQPFPYIKTIYYMNLDLYRYFIGRADQSINEQVMVRRVSQQLRITKMMLESHDLQKVRAMEPKLAKYMSNYLSMMISITSVLLAIDGSLESENIANELWHDLKKNHTQLYYKIKYRSFLCLSSFKGKLARLLTIVIYRLARRIYHFN